MVHSSSHTPSIYSSKEHQISPSLIDADVITTLHTLTQAGYIAYLVGGSVRDLLIGHVPKDFDISTSATPEQIKALFRKRCLLIGRRFRLAHIRYGQKIFEVSTFRSGDNMDSRLILRDNQWGTPAEDVARRDFTINALFYDASNQTVIDYIGGYDDLLKHQLRAIGDPVVRFSQDPVRMIRLLKFKARFDFAVDPATLQALTVCCSEILKSATPRLLEEICRMLESGYATRFFQLLLESGMLQFLQPELHAFLLADEGMRLFHYLEIADEWILKHKMRLDRSLLICCCLFPMFEALLQRRFLSKGTKPHIAEVIDLAREVVERVIDHAFVSFPNKICQQATFILEAQYRLSPFSFKPSRYRSLLRHPDFTLAFQFFYLRSFIDPTLKETYLTWKQWWKEQHPSMRKRS